MEKRQVLILAALALLFVIGGTVTVYQRGRLNPIAGKVPGRLYARPGATRPQARLSVGKGPRRPGPEDAADGAPGGGVQSRESSIEIIGGDGIETPSYAEQLSQQLLHATFPKEGVADLVASLQTVRNTVEAAQIYTALGACYASGASPDFDQAALAFAEAARLAPSVEARLITARVHASVLTEQSQVEQALAVLEEALNATDSVAQVRLELELMRANALADLERAELAEAAYRQVMEAAYEASKESDLSAADIYRHAGLRLSRLYRSLGRSNDAEALAQEVQRRARLLEP